MLQAIAIDDEPFALEVIKSLIEDVPFVKISAYFTDAVEAISYLQKNRVDVLFLDIKMPKISGLDFIRTMTKPPLVIFTTAYSEHAVHGFELNAIDYLLKPFSFDRFLKACSKAHEQVELRTAHQNIHETLPPIFIKSGYEHIQVDQDDILYVESVGNYVRFEMKGQSIVSRSTLNEVEILLSGSAFTRLHRSYIVAKRQVSKVDKRSVWIGDIELPIGSGYSNAILKMINNKI